AVIAREFGDLVKFPGLMIETSDTAKQKGRSITVDLVVDLRVLEFEKWHKFSLLGNSQIVRTLELGAISCIDALDKTALLELAHNAIVYNIFRFDLANLRVAHAFEGRHRLSIHAAQ